MQICCDSSSGCITIDQGKYIYETLERFGMKDCNGASTPLDSNQDLFLMSKDKMVDLNVPYRELIGSLTYIALGTRPDIAYAVGALSQFNSCYDKIHWMAAKRVTSLFKRYSRCKIEV